MSLQLQHLAPWSFVCAQDDAGVSGADSGPGRKGKRDEAWKAKRDEAWEARRRFNNLKRREKFAAKKKAKAAAARCVRCGAVRQQACRPSASGQPRHC